MHLTPRTAVLAALAAVGLLRAPGWGPLLLVNAVVAALVLVDVGLAGSVRRLIVAREGDASVRLGSTAHTTLVVTNRGRRRVRGIVRDAWQPSAGIGSGRHRLDVAPGERRRLTAELVPTRRGDRHPVRVTVRTTGPLGLAGRQGRHLAPWRLRVLPGFGSRRFLPERLARLKVVEGQVAARGAGRGTEVDSLRTWVDGDDARAVDWRATARSRDLIVRVHRPERDRRVILCIDSGRTSATRVGDSPRLDHAFDAALLVTALAERAQDKVDLLIHDAVLRADVPSAGRRLLPRQADVMAQVEPALVECDHRALVSLVLQRASRRALVVLLVDLSGPVVEESLLPALPTLLARHTVVVAAVADPALAELAELPPPGRPGGRASGLHLAAAARRAQTERRRVATALRRLGVTVVDAEPDRFPAAVADAYLALKAAGRL